MRPGRRRVALLAVGAVALAVPAVAAAQASPVELQLAGTPAAARGTALDAAAAWRETLEAHRAPQLPTPGDTESVILVLAGPAAIAADPDERAAAAAAISARQDEIAPVLASLGATVTFRYRVLVNAIGVRLPAGRLEALAALPEVAAVVPVGFLAPALTGTPAAPTATATAAADAARPSAPAGADAVGPAHIALIDAGVDASHPWLGGGIGPTFPVIGGADLVDGDGDPSRRPGRSRRRGARHADGEPRAAIARAARD